MNWRTAMPGVDAEFAGRVAPDLSRQEVRALKRQIARAEAGQQKQAARRAKVVERKRRRAGL